MAFEKIPTEPDDRSPGQQKYGRLVRMFREGYLSLCIYKNVYEKRTFYDIVLYRKIRTRSGAYEYRRGANLKPGDLESLAVLTAEASDFMRSLEKGEENVTR